jgi:hypothetical protein
MLRVCAAFTVTDGDFAVFGKLLTKIFGTNNERVIKRLLPNVALINARSRLKCCR